MTHPALACWLAEPDGTVLSHGTAHLRATPQMDEVLVTDVDQPGRLVHRCLLGPVRGIVLHLSDGRCLPAQVERVFFDPHLGRTCVLQLGSARVATQDGALAERREPTSAQIAAIQVIMRLFVQDDLGTGISARHRLHCAACERPRPMPGFLYYAPHFLCNECGTAYEVARAQGLVRSAAEFVQAAAPATAVAVTLPPAPAPGE